MPTQPAIRLRTEPTAIVLPAQGSEAIRLTREDSGLANRAPNPRFRPERVHVRRAYVDRSGVLWLQINRSYAHVSLAQIEAGAAESKYCFEINARNSLDWEQFEQGEAPADAIVGAVRYLFSPC
jgi:hypothetical protein